MIKLPSLRTLTYGLQQVLMRFPLVVVAAGLKACVIIYLMENLVTSPNYNLAIRLTMVVFLALPLLLSLHLVAERRQWHAGLQLAGMGAIVLALLLYFFTLETEPIQRDYYRFGMFMAGSHLLVSFALFVGYNEPNGFWQFNKTMLLQLVTATLYAGTLFLGLVVAIETVKFLFDIKFPISIEADLLALTFGFFHTLFFLNGFPQHLDILEDQSSYSPSVKVFTQYVLLPLVVIYLTILYVYIGKIAIQWQLPEGGVAYLVMAFSVAGILALLLVYPLRERPDERWIRLFTRRFHLALFPLIILLFAAIYRRIHDYGITENRYLVAALAIWLAGISFYFLFSKKEDIRWIPLSLCIISFMLAVGPWSIFSVSRRDQAQRIEELLRAYNLLGSDGTLKGKAVLPKDSYDELLSGIRYFRSRRESGALRSIFTDLPQTTDQSALADAIEKKLRTAVDQEAPSAEEAATLTYGVEGARRSLEIRTAGFDYLWTFEFYGDETLERGDWKIASEDNGTRLSVFKSGLKIVTWDIAAHLKELKIRYGDTDYELRADALSFSYPGLRMLLQSASKNGEIYSYKGVILMKE